MLSHQRVEGKKKANVLQASMKIPPFENLDRSSVIATWIYLDRNDLSENFLFAEKILPLLASEIYLEIFSCSV